MHGRMDIISTFYSDFHVQQTALWREQIRNSVLELNTVRFGTESLDPETLVFFYGNFFFGEKKNSFGNAIFS